ncbi:MAG TPA: hypothetical protein VMC79_09590 [Rectinemataceae bacterium]|nr:hypothetical protein [Rectinemataceae bacterium]
MPDASPTARLLLDAGLRPTAVRQRVFAALSAEGRALSHRELAESLGDLDRVSIFRSLKLLKKSGLVHGIQGIDGTFRYVLSVVAPPAASAQGPGSSKSGGATVRSATAGSSLSSSAPGGCPGGHPHFLCTNCGIMSCLLDQEMPRVRVPEGSLVRGKQLLVYGLCAACADSSVSSRSGSRRRSFK